MNRLVSILRDLWWGLQDWRAVRIVRRLDVRTMVKLLADTMRENARLKRYAQVVQHLGLDEDAVMAIEKLLGRVPSSPEGVNVAFEMDAATTWSQTTMHPPRRLIPGDAWTLTITCSGHCAPGITQSHVHQVKFKVLS